MSHDKPHDCIILWFYLGPCNYDVSPLIFWFLLKSLCCVLVFIYIYITFNVPLGLQLENCVKRPMKRPEI